MAVWLGFQVVDKDSFTHGPGVYTRSSTHLDLSPPLSLPLSLSLSHSPPPPSLAGVAGLEAEAVLSTSVLCFWPPWNTDDTSLF